MDAMKTIGRGDCKAINEAIAAALKPVAERFGLDLTVKGGRFDASCFRPTIELTTKDAAADAWTRDARLFQLPDDAFGKTVILSIGGAERLFTIAGLNLGATRFPVLVKGVRDGKDFRVTADSVRRALGAMQQATAKAVAGR